MIIKDEGFFIRKSDNYLEIIPDFEMRFPEYTLFKYSRKGHYLLKEYTRRGEQEPGEYFELVAELIEENTLYIFQEYSDLLMYLTKKLYSKQFMKNTFEVF